MKVIPIFDAGHGGMIDGVYTTAPKKMYKHEDGSIAYEGVINRKIKNKAISLCIPLGISYFDVTPGNVDYSLGSRVQQANAYYDKYSDEKDTIVLYTSIHCNAGKGTGFEVYTSPGETKSDGFATIWLSELEDLFLNHKFRKDFSDGDPDKEALFYVLKHTRCPAVLGELLFFDNFEDWVYMQTEDFIEKSALSIINMIKRIEKGA